MPDVFVSKDKTEKVEKISKPAALTIPSGTSVSPFGSFYEHPRNISFANQNANETVLLFLRRHFITNVPWIFFTLVLIGLAPLIGFLLQSTDFPITFLPERYVTILLLFYYLVVFAFVLTNFMSWFYNIGLVTTQRVVDIDFADIVYHDVAITKLAEIEEVRYQQVGFIPSFFDFGNVYAETASDTANFEFLSVPHPSLANKIIGDLLGGGSE